MIKGLGSTPRPAAVERAMGSSNTAVALLLNTWVEMLVSSMKPPKTRDSKPKTDDMVNQYYARKPGQLETPLSPKNKPYPGKSIYPPKGDVGDGNAMFIDLIFRQQSLFLETDFCGIIPI